MFSTAATISAGLLRISLGFFVPLIERPETATPFTSISRLKEGVFLLSHNIDPYNGSVVQQSPLLLLLNSILPALWTPLGFALIDAATAYVIYSIEKLIRDPSATPFVATIYLLHPFVVLTSFSCSSTAISNLAILITLYLAYSRSSTFNVMSALSIASNIDIYAFLLFPFCVLIRREAIKKKKSQYSTTLKYDFLISIALLGFHQVLLLFLERYVMGSWNFIYPIISALSVSDLTPNIGLSWYFFIEMFDHFRSFFVGVFQIHVAAYALPLCIKLRHEPLFASIIMLGIIAIFKSYPTIGDVSLVHTLLFLYNVIFSHMRTLYLSTSLIVYASFLLPTFHYLWLYAGSANANFFYASTLVWALGHVLLLIDSVWAFLRYSFITQVDPKGELDDQKYVIVQR